MYSFAGARLSTLLTLNFTPGGLGLPVTPDERYRRLTHPDEKGAGRMPVENFR